ncbi:hypothetical protein [Dyadobacter sp. NIV53]|uniref:hypothetical protein n=1 Tax=Dyadobacter sp. NIV53 TaxID=2861765 RepID=UPI001C87000D|nr:hypothetical protein [Dyadobacter sp. NIV53]
MSSIIIDKPKIRKGYSYVLQSSVLQKAIADSKLYTSVHLKYWTPNNNENVDWLLIRGEYWFPNQQVSYPRFFIEIAAVPVNLKQQAAFVVQTAVISKLINWMVQQEQLELRSTILEPYFRAVLTNGSLIIT